MSERLLYDEAIMQIPFGLMVQDPEIKQGHVETIKISTTKGILKRPWAMQGGFAIVYKFCTQSGNYRALRFFLGPINNDTRFRYERIRAYFRKYISEFTVDFKYHDSGILLRNQDKPQGQIYPLIEMDWIEGTTLVEKVNELCKERDREGIKHLNDQWTTLLQKMHQAHIAHGHLSGENVMVRTNGHLVLVDYDGVYIPDFTGLPSVIFNAPDFNHPLMSQRQFNERMDDFSALVIYTALMALQAQPELWEKYMHQHTKGKSLGTNLMFVQQDFVNPQQSSLIQELERIKNVQVGLAIQELKKACLQSIDQVRFPFYLIEF